VVAKSACLLRAGRTQSSAECGPRSGCLRRAPPVERPARFGRGSPTAVLLKFGRAAPRPRARQVSAGPRDALRLAGGIYLFIILYYMFARSPQPNSDSDSSSDPDSGRTGSLDGWLAARSNGKGAAEEQPEGRENENRLLI